MTVIELAAMLHISTRTVWRLKSAGKIPKPTTLGGSVRWSVEVVRDWIAQGCPDKSAKR